MRQMELLNISVENLDEKNNGIQKLVGLKDSQILQWITNNTQLVKVAGVALSVVVVVPLIALMLNRTDTQLIRTNLSNLFAITKKFEEINEKIKKLKKKEEENSEEITELKKLLFSKKEKIETLLKFLSPQIIREVQKNVCKSFQLNNEKIIFSQDLDTHIQHLIHMQNIYPLHFPHLDINLVKELKSIQFNQKPVTEVDKKNYAELTSFLEEQCQTAEKKRE